MTSPLVNQKNPTRSSVIGYSGPSAQTPISSPGPVHRPASSSSSRSSYSPTTSSPLISRHHINGIPGNNNNNNTNSTPCCSPSQTRHVLQANTSGQRQSPSSYHLPSNMQIIQNDISRSSPSASPLPLRPGSTPIMPPRNFFPTSPNPFQSRSTTTTPDSNCIQHLQQHPVITSVDTTIGMTKVFSIH